MGQEWAERMERRGLFARLWRYKFYVLGSLLLVLSLGSCLFYYSLIQTNSQNLDTSNATISSGKYETVTVESTCSTNFSEVSVALEKIDPDIKEINLMYRNISCLPIDIFMPKKNLVELDLRGNPLYIPFDRPWIRHPKIRVLNISDCGLGPLTPVVFENLPGLKAVIMVGNYGCVETKKMVKKRGLDIKIVCGANFKLDK